MFCTSETVVLELQHVLDALFGNTLFPRSLGILGASHLMYPSTCPASRRVCARAREGSTDFRGGRPADLPPITWGTPAETMPLEAPGGAVSGLTGTGCGYPSRNGRRGLYGARVASGERGVGATAGARARRPDRCKLSDVRALAHRAARRPPRALAASTRAGTPATRARATMRRTAARVR